MSMHQNKFYLRLFHLFCVWLICNIELECAIAELYTSQSKYLKNNLQYFSSNHGKYQFSLETAPTISTASTIDTDTDTDTNNDHDISNNGNADDRPNYGRNGDIKVNDNFLNKLSWKCANNSSCLYNLLSSLLESYRRGDIIKLGSFDLIKLAQPYKSPKNVHNSQNGRSMSTIMNFFNGYAVRVPIGPMVFSIQRSTDDADYIEVALLKKVTNTQARFGGNGGGGGSEFRKQRQRKHDDKKEVQMFIPLYLAATTFGWTVLAFKTVSLMVLKALTLSKVAFVVAALVLLKKMMDTTSEKLMYHYNEPPPYIMPYGLDYGMHTAMSATPIEMAGTAGDDMYAASMPYHAANAAISSPLISGGGALTLPGLEHLTAESQIHQTGTPNLLNDTQLLTPSYDGSLSQMIKRTSNNIYPGRRKHKLLRPSHILPFPTPINIQLLHKRIIAVAEADVFENAGDDEEELEEP